MKASGLRVTLGVMQGVVVGLAVSSPFTLPRHFTEENFWWLMVGWCALILLSNAISYAAGLWANTRLRVTAWLLDEEIDELVRRLASKGGIRHG